MKMKYMLVIALALMMVIGAGTASAKSLYVLSDTNSASSPIQAYDINTAGVTYQATHTTGSGWGEVGVAIDSNSGYLFITHESSGLLYLVNGTTMTAAGTVTAPGASNLAGIVVDEGKQRVYAVDRSTTNLYVYDWDSSAKTLTAVTGSPFTLSAAAYGIALDEANDLLYVTSYTTTVRYYDTVTWAQQGTIMLPQSAIGIAVEDGKYLYTGAGFAGSNVLSQYDLTTSTESHITNTYGVMGLAVDQATGRLYVTTGFSGDILQVFDSSLTLIDSTGDIGNPTGLCVPRTGVSFNPLNLAKTDGVTQVYQGGTLTYTISYDNAQNTNLVNGVTIVDTLPAEVTYVSSTGGTYDTVNHTVTWDIGTLAAGAPSATVSITVTVGASTPIGTMLDNAVTIDSDDTAQTTQHDDDTEVVASTQNAYVVSSDNAGVEQNVFALDENVYCYAGNLPANDPAVDIYVVADQTWSVGDIIGADVGDGAETVATDGAGEIGVTQIWAQPLTPGNYDIIVDLDQDGQLDAGEPVDGVTLQGFEAIPEFPTVALPIAAILGLAFFFQRRRNE